MNNQNRYYRITIYDESGNDIAGFTYETWYEVARFMIGFVPDHGDFQIKIINNFSFPER